MSEAIKLLPVAVMLLAATAGCERPPGPIEVTRVHLTIPPQNLETYAHTATEIVHGRVLWQTPVVPEEGFAYTEIALDIDTAVKGALPGEVVVRVAGAASAARATIVVGAPTFADGEEVLLFLWRDPGVDHYGILGLGHGTYRVDTRPDGTKAVKGFHAAEGEELPVFFRRVEEALVTDADVPAGD